MKLKMFNYRTGKIVEIDDARLSDKQARQLVPQTQEAQAIYAAAIRRGDHITLAISEALLARFDLRAS